MALRKAVELSNGVIVDYWKIKTIQIDPELRHARLQLVAWTDEIARNENKDPAVPEAYVLLVNPFFSHQGLRTAELFPVAYDLLKSAQGFEFAENA